MLHIHIAELQSKVSSVRFSCEQPISSYLSVANGKKWLLQANGYRTRQEPNKEVAATAKELSVDAAAVVLSVVRWHFHILKKEPRAALKGFLGLFLAEGRVLFNKHSLQCGSDAHLMLLLVQIGSLKLLLTSREKSYWSV